MNKITIISHVENGSPKRNRKLIADAFRSFDGKDIEITIQKKRKRRSNNQNSYYHGIIIPLVRLAIKDTWGDSYSHEETHEFLKAKFNFTEKFNENTGEILRLTKSTTQNTTVEMEEYHEEIRRFALEWFGVIIPLPNEDLKLNI